MPDGGHIVRELPATLADLSKKKHISGCFKHAKSKNKGMDLSTHWRDRLTAQACQK